VEVRDDEVESFCCESAGAAACITPENPPIMNIQTKPSANIIGVRIIRCPPQMVPIQLKILTPVGTAIAIVASANAAVATVPIPVVNM
jgi:hypothetical protein